MHCGALTVFLFLNPQYLCGAWPTECSVNITAKMQRDPELTDRPPTNLCPRTRMSAVIGDPEVAATQAGWTPWHHLSPRSRISEGRLWLHVCPTGFQGWARLEAGPGGLRLQRENSCASRGPLCFGAVGQYPGSCAGALYFCITSSAPGH